MNRQPLSRDEVVIELRNTPLWELAPGNKIQRQFKFDKYLAGLKFVDAVAHLSDKEDHHPDIDFRWGSVTVAYSTHSAGGLTELDFRLAKLVDGLPKAE